MDYDNIFVDKMRVNEFKNKDISQTLSDIVDTFVNYSSFESKLCDLHWEAAPSTFSVDFINPYRLYNFQDGRHAYWNRFPYTRGSMFIVPDLSEHPVVHIMVIVPKKEIVISIMFWSMINAASYPNLINFKNI